MLKKIIIGLAALIVLGGIGVQLFLQYGLTDSLRKYVLPAAREKLQVDVAVDKVGLNLLAGSFSMHGVRVGNPPGFVEPDLAALKRLRICLSLPALFKDGVAEIRKAEVKDGVITVVRGKNGALNIEPLLGMREEAAPGAGAPAEPPGGGRPAAAAPVPQVFIRNLEVKTALRYVDYLLTAEPFRLGLELQGQLHDVANYGNENVLSGSLALQGILLVEAQRSAFDLRGQIAPLVDPKRLSFDLAGSIQTIDLKGFQPLIRKHGIEGGLVSGTATLLCKQGVFDPEKSMLRLTLKNIRLTEEKQAQLRGIRPPESIQIVVPLQGTLERITVDWSGVLEKTLQNPDVIGAVLKNLMTNRGQAARAAKPEAPEASGTATTGEVQRAGGASKGQAPDINKALKDIFRE